ncbi:MAG TPA: helix-hairpin-helix domain-containing protein, partial [Ktedonobacterales bacterium]
IEIPVVGIAKEDHGAIGTYEEFHMTGQAEPLVLDRGSQGLYLMQRVRDEAHRFAITYHRQIRSKRTFKSVLDDVPGIGPKRKKALLKHFGSTKAIGAASADEIAAALSISPDLAARIKEHIGGGHAIAVE